MGGAPDFGARARAYDRLRPQDEAWWARFDALVEVGDLRGRRVLDVGCGTGALAAALAERAAARVWGVEPSEEMLAEARARATRGVSLKRGRAEQLPFRDGWFERVTMSLVVHLVERTAAFAEARRVLGADGRIAVATFDHAHFDTYWLNPWFPSIAEIDRARFPTHSGLQAELEAAGFRDVTARALHSRRLLSRDDALARARGRHISTFDLLGEEEVRAGLERLEAELPDEVEVRLEQLVVAAAR